MVDISCQFQEFRTHRLRERDHFIYPPFAIFRSLYIAFFINIAMNVDSRYERWLLATSYDAR